MSDSRITEAVRTILASGRAPIHGQPIRRYDGRIQGVEVLLRAGDIPPLRILQEAARLNVSEDVEKAVMTSAFDVASRRDPSLGPVHVNITRTALAADHVLQHIQILAIGRPGIASNICLELSERERLDDDAIAARSLGILSEMGFRFSLDDFGVGYNHLHAAASIGISSIKVDQSIVHAASRPFKTEARSRAKRLILGISLLAKSTDADLILEGIETEADLHLMQELKAHGQGFLLGAPDEASLTPQEHIAEDAA